MGWRKKNVRGRASKEIISVAVLNGKAIAEREEGRAWEEEGGENDEVVGRDQSPEGTEGKEDTPPKDGGDSWEEDATIAITLVWKISSWESEEKDGCYWHLETLKRVSRT